MIGRATSGSIILIMITAISVIAGTTGYIAGQITNETGEPLWGTTVLIIGTGLGAMTSRDGIYCITDIDPGIYRLQVNMIGWTSQTIEEVSVLSNDTTFINTTLETCENMVLAVITQNTEDTDSSAIMGCIAGRITNESGEPLWGAAVLIIGTRLGAMTSRDGIYCITDIDTDIYRLQVSMVGMYSQTLEEVSVAAGDTTFVDFLPLRPDPGGNLDVH